MLLSRIKAAFTAATQPSAYYEAGNVTRYRKRRYDLADGNRTVARAGQSLRTYARYLDENLDLAHGALDRLTQFIVGPNGIQIEPQPRSRDGEVHEVFAGELLELWRDWCTTPEVSWELDWPAVQRLLVRAWLRDGEAFAQVLEGDIPGLDHGTNVPLSLELLEADLCPLDLNDEARGIQQGIERNAWGRPRAYHLYLRHPYGISAAYSTTIKRVPADRMLHLRLADRIGQGRGVSVFASVLQRLDDLKDLEESERIAAKVAASMAAAIKKGAPDQYQDDEEDEPRELTMRPGMIFDDLRPGESIETIDTKRPNAAITDWRYGQLRAAASGAGLSYSAMARHYDGSYSAQRQEMVEQTGHYAVLTNQVVGRLVRPIWERFVALAIATRAVRVPGGLVPESLDDADYRGPAQPWVDPVKEATAWETLLGLGLTSPQAVIRARGDNPAAVLRQRAEWARKLAAHGLPDPSFVTPPASAAASAHLRNVLEDDRRARAG